MHVDIIGEAQPEAHPSLAAHFSAFMIHEICGVVGVASLIAELPRVVAARVRKSGFKRIESISNPVNDYVNEMRKMWIAFSGACAHARAARAAFFARPWQLWGISCARECAAHTHRARDTEPASRC